MTGNRKEIRNGIRRFFRLDVPRAPRVVDDVDREIAFHLQSRIEQLIERGYSDEDARREAERRFGSDDARDMLTAAAHHREKRMEFREWLAGLRQDIRHAIRRLAAQPSFVLVVLGTLAIGVGANATVFTWLQALVIDPMPLVHDAHTLVALNTATESGDRQSISYPDYLDWQAQSKTLRDIVVYRRQRLSMRLPGGTSTEAVWTVLASSNYFDALGVRAEHGRTFLPTESAPAATVGAAPVAVISHALWQRAFASRPDIVGTTILLNNHALTVIGVAPKNFFGTTVGFTFDVWTPITLYPTLIGESAEIMTWRARRWMQGFARLAPGTSLEAASNELATIGARTAATDASAKGLSPVARPMLDAESSGTFKPLLFALLGATGLVLLIGCANLAGLQLVRVLGRRREIGVRLALGAPPRRVIRQFMVEAAFLGILGLAAGLLVAQLSRNALATFFAGTDYPLAAMPGVGWKVFAFAAAITALTLVIVGVWPAVRVVASSAWQSLRDGERASTGRSSLHTTLVVSQLALAVIGVSVAGQFVHSLWKLQHIETGFIDPEHTLLASTDFDLGGAKYAGWGPGLGTRARAVSDLVAKARTIPGVLDVAASYSVPLGMSAGFDGFDIKVEGHAPQPGESMSFSTNFVDESYFTVVGPGLVAGRGFTRNDDGRAPPVAVVSEEFARRFWGQSPNVHDAALGKRMQLGGRIATIVGIARDSKLRSITESPQPFIYLAFAQWAPTAVTLNVRSTAQAAVLSRALRLAFREVDPELPVLDIHPLSTQTNGALAVQRIGALLLSALSAMALAVAALGLYGVLAFMVAQRRREIGIRMALGARPRDVLTQFMGYGTRISLIGFVIGIPAAIAISRLIRAQVYGTGATEPLMLLTTIAMFAIAVMLASMTTALRATRVDPAMTMREE